MGTSTVGVATDNTSTLRAAIFGHIMEHGIEPTFVLMSSDVAAAIFREVESTPTHKSLITVGRTADDPMCIDLGTGPIEIGQVTGRGRVELVVDVTLYKVRKAH